VRLISLIAGPSCFRMGSSIAQKHHANDKHHSTKRKQPPAGLTAPSPKKAAVADHKTQHEKLSAEAQQALRQRHRQAVSALYTAYEQLSSSGAEAAGDSAAFDVLLDGAKGVLNMPEPASIAESAARRSAPPSRLFMHQFDHRSACSLASSDHMQCCIQFCISSNCSQSSQVGTPNASYLTCQTSIGRHP